MILPTLYGVWYRVSRTVFPFVSLRRYNKVLDEYDDNLDTLQEAYDQLAEELDAALIQLDDMASLPPIEDFMVTIPGVAVITESHVPYTDDDHAIANMQNDGVIDPNHYREV
jgi:hypothetical protein